MSKELEALKIARVGGVGYTIDEYNEAVDIVEKALIDYQTLKREYEFGVEQYNELLNECIKEHKALEIIKESLYIASCNLEHFTDIEGKTEDKFVIRFGDMFLSQEEYDLLKATIFYRK